MGGKARLVTIGGLCLLATLLFFFWVFNPFSPKTAGLKITTTPEATIFLNEEHIGKSPIEKSDLPPGEYTIRASTETQTVTKKARVNPHSWTLFNIEFGPTDEQISGEIVSLEEGQGLIITSVPDGATIVVDGSARGVTPLSLRSLSPGAHTVTVSKDEYHPRTLENLKIASGRLVTVEVDLARAGGSEKRAATESAQPKSEAQKKRVTILETGTGWLRVRAAPSLSAPEIAKVNVGEEYELIEEKDGWGHIVLSAGHEGWVSSQFVKEVSSPNPH